MNRLMELLATVKFFASSATRIRSQFGYRVARRVLARMGTIAFATTVVGVGAHAATPVRAAAVEDVLPTKPFQKDMAAQTGITEVAGVSSGRLGVSSVTITNFLSTAAYVQLRSVVVADADCQSTIVSFGDFFKRIYVQPTSTLNLTFPTPVVIGNGTGAACLQASTPFGGNVSVLVVGKYE